MDLNRVMLSERSQMQRLYTAPNSRKDYNNIVTERRLVVSRGKWLGKGKRYKGDFWVMNMILVVVTQLYIFVKTHQIIDF